jgi:extradiol dioxygenase family protein
MAAIKAVAHFSIPVSDVPKSTQFYTEVVGCRHSHQTGRWSSSTQPELASSW